MQQKAWKKTICFAMKCLGISLYMSKKYKFDFTPILIPVDSRVTKLTQKAGLCLSDKEQEIQATWDNVLSLLQKHDSRITMIELGSLVWQIATKHGSQL